MSYLWLLTDQWPSFSESPEDPVQVAAARVRNQLNRAAVFFRLILRSRPPSSPPSSTPVLAVAGFFIWLIVLFRGRVPQPVFDGTASAVRYQTRFYAYAVLADRSLPQWCVRRPRRPDEAAAATDDLRRRSSTRARGEWSCCSSFSACWASLAQIAVSAARGNDAQNRQAADDRLAEAYHSMELADASKCLGVSDQLGCATEAAQQNAG